MTITQFKARTKTVTRRFGWWSLQPGDEVQGVEKAMGLRKGDTIKSLGMIRIVSTRAETLNSITQKECDREGFPHMTPDEFVKMLCQHYRCEHDKIVNRIEFEYI